MRSAWQPDIYWAPRAKAGGGWIAYKDSPSPPPAPDYSAAATTQGNANVQSAIVNKLLGNVNQNTPYGSLTYNQTGSTDVPAIGGQPGFQIPQYTSNIAFSPTGQKLQDLTSQGQLSYGQTGVAGLQRVQDSFAKPQDTQSISDLQDKSYAQQTARLDPQWQQAQGHHENQLANQGLVPGTEAYDNSMRVFNEGKNDAYTQARTQATNLAPQLLQEQLAIRNQPLAETNALFSGAQPTLPQFSLSQQGTATPGNYQQAAQSQGAYNQGQYNAQVGQQNAGMSGLFSLGSAFAPSIGKSLFAAAV